MARRCCGAVIVGAAVWFASALVGYCSFGSPETTRASPVKLVEGNAPRSNASRPAFDRGGVFGQSGAAITSLICSVCFAMALGSRTASRASEIERGLSAELGDALHASPQIVLLFRVSDLECVYGNPSARRELCGNGDADSLPRADDAFGGFGAASFRELIAPLVSRGVEALKFDAELQGKDGRRRDVACTMHLARFGGAECLAAQCIDLSQRASETRGLRGALAMFERAGRIGNWGGWEFDVLEERLTWSPQVRRIHGVD
ncbi:MAG: hypothetical protein KDA61_17950, partial [Planctomycetales bacterium]|nr:hypothetical protein [Planctomycetales bacterium]